MARQSLSLAAYKALSRRGGSSPQSYAAARPEGELVWLHSPRSSMFDAVCSLSRRIIEQRHGCSVLLTFDTPQPQKIASLPEGVILERPPTEHTGSANRFLEHWRPDLGLWLNGWLRPNLIDLARKKGVDLLLLWAEAEGFDGRRDRWLPELSRHLLLQFQTATAVDQSARQKLLRLGLPSDRISLTGVLRPTGPVLPSNQTDQDEIAASMAGRPVWLAASAEPEDIPIVLKAHREALGRAHRLLLLLAPSSPAAYEAALAHINSSEFRCAHWAEGDLPADNHAVLLAEDNTELGLWYRLAAVCLIGGTLNGSQTTRNPLEAAALGSAVLYGPNLGDHLEAYSRLAHAGAARIVNNAATLAAAISNLIAPDQAAAMAHAGWDVATEGGPAIDDVVERVHAFLDERERPAT